MSKNILLFLDRYEDEYAVLLDPQSGCVCDMPREWLPDQIKEGTYVSLVVTEKRDETAKAKDTAADLLKELKKRQG